MDEVRQTIEALSEAMTELFRHGDRRQIAQFYAEDGAVLGPCGQRFEGREAIALYWSSFITAQDWHLELVRLDGNADLALQIAHSTITYVFGDDHVANTIKVMLIWKRQTDGIYRITTDRYL